MVKKINKVLDFIVLPFLFISILGLAFACIFFNTRSYNKNSILPINFALADTAAVAPKIPDKEVTKNQPQITSSVNLEVPFTSQAPFGLWLEYPFAHTCEEASVLMLHYYLNGNASEDQSAVKQDLVSMVNFENNRYGFSNDTDAEQTAQLIRDYYGYGVRVVYNPSIEDIKKELASGNPVIVPTSGRLLGNPHFTPPGPLYHMLVIKGYDADGFITNDPGTSFGADYKYSYKVLQNAIRDFDLENTGDAKAVMLIVEKSAR
jgi:uncharacterized protein YvpB